MLRNSENPYFSRYYIQIASSRTVWIIFIKRCLCVPDHHCFFIVLDQYTKFIVYHYVFKCPVVACFQRMSKPYHRSKKCVWLPESEHRCPKKTLLDDIIVICRTYREPIDRPTYMLCACVCVDFCFSPRSLVVCCRVSKLMTGRVHRIE